MISGSCHCGRIAFEVDGEVGDIQKVFDCNCSHCSRKGYLLWFRRRDQVHLKTPESDMSTYLFNRHAIRHHFCPTCGCAPFGFGTAPDGTATAAVNVRCLEGLDLATIERVPVDGRSR